MFDFHWLLLALSGVVLTSYLFDLVAKRVRIPAVVMLIAAGVGMRIALDLFGVQLDFVDRILPILGTLGLVLIVLEGALELRLSRSAQGMIVRSAAMAFFGLAITGFLIAWAIKSFFLVGWWQAWLLATPFAVISSAVVIPAAKVLDTEQRDHVVYESSLSDIFGVLLFYALLDHERGITSAIFNMLNGITLSMLIGGITGLAILILIDRIEAHVRFVPMIFGIVFVYAGSKIMGLAPLISVLAVGLILNNTILLNRFERLAPLVPDGLIDEVDDFRRLTAELTFIVRTFFFLLLGYSTSVLALADPWAWLAALALLAIVYLTRKILMRGLFGPHLAGLFWFAPRGLITVLLFINIPPDARITDFPEGTLMLTVLGSALFLAVGTIRAGHRPA